MFAGGFAELYPALRLEVLASRKLNNPTGHQPKLETSRSSSNKPGLFSSSASSRFAPGA